MNFSTLSFVALVFSSALAIIPPAPVQVERNEHTTPGITVLLMDSMQLVRGKRVGLITNHTARDAKGRSTIDLLHEAPGVQLVALFAPEHGIRGIAEGGARISSSIDEKTGIPIYSLYGDTKAPTARMLANIDVLVYDIQDVGARMYTYVWTMTLAAEAAKKAGIPFVILDRPNPIRADRLEGGLIEKRYRSFTGLHNVPIRYGLTPAELVKYLEHANQIDSRVTVVPMRGYRRSMWWEETGGEWIKPSPNIPGVEAALLYPGISFFEATNVSEGRGTKEPFRVVGARWLNDAQAVAAAMNGKKLNGVRFEAVTRRIGKGEKFGGETIPMIRINVRDRDAIRSTEIAANLLREVYMRHPRQFRWQKGNGIEELSGSAALRTAVEHGGIDALLTQWRQQSDEFSRESAPFRLYPE